MTLGVGIVLGVITTATGPASLILIPLLILSIVVIAMLSRHDFDIILYLVTAAVFLLPMNNFRLSSSLTVGDGFIVVALLLSVVMRSEQRDLRISGMDGLLVGLSIIVTGGLVGSFFADSVASSIAGVGKFGAATLALPLLFGLWRPDVAKVRIVAWSIVLGSCANAVVGILFIRTVGRALGLSSQPNHLALASLMAVGLGLGMAMSAGPRQQMLLTAAVAVLTVGTVMSGSRSGLIAEVLVIGAIAWLVHDRKLILTALTAGVLFVVALGFGMLGRSGSSAVGRLLGGGGAAISDQARAESLRAALQTISHHPLTGQGFENALATHDIVLELAATAGVLGLFGFGFVGWMAIRPIWARYRWGAMRRRAPGDVLLIGAIASVLGFFANGLFGNQLYDRYIWIVFTIAAALSHQLGAEHDPTPARRPNALSQQPSTI